MRRLLQQLVVQVICVLIFAACFCASRAAAQTAGPAQANEQASTRERQRQDVRTASSAAADARFERHRAETTQRRCRDGVSAHSDRAVLDLRTSEHHPAGSRGVQGKVQRAEQPDELGAERNDAPADALHRLRALANDRSLCRYRRRDGQRHRECRRDWRDTSTWIRCDWSRACR